MAFDFKKEDKEFYMPKSKPQIVEVPKANYVAVRGKGNPNEEGGAYLSDSYNKRLDKFQYVLITTEDKTLLGFYQ